MYSIIISPEKSDLNTWTTSYDRRRSGYAISVHSRAAAAKESDVCTAHPIRFLINDYDARVRRIYTRILSRYSRCGSPSAESIETRYPWIYRLLYTHTHKRAHARAYGISLPPTASLKTTSILYNIYFRGYTCVRYI